MIHLQLNERRCEVPDTRLSWSLRVAFLIACVDRCAIECARPSADVVELRLDAATRRAGALTEQRDRNPAEEVVDGELADGPVEGVEMHGDRAGGGRGQKVAQP